uniref:VIP-like peptide isoform 2 VLP2 n=1 Tax=Desmognathus ocoee TaxID=179530 RepID=A0A0H4A831_9SALA|nr:VIP-like peptide isoform 2 VLP2 [Desmognathus ocoee]
MQHKRNLLFLSCVIMMTFLNLSGHELPTLGIYSAMSNRALDEEILSVKRHADALFTAGYSRFRYNKAMMKYLKSIVTRPESIVSKKDVEPTGIIHDPFIFPGYRTHKY